MGGAYNEHVNMKNEYKILVVILKESDHLDDISIHGRMRNVVGGLDRNNQAWDKDRCE